MARSIIAVIASYVRLELSGICHAVLDCRRRPGIQAAHVPGFEPLDCDVVRVHFC